MLTSVEKRENDNDRDLELILDQNEGYQCADQSLNKKTQEASVEASGWIDCGVETEPAIPGTSGAYALSFDDFTEALILCDALTRDNLWCIRIKFPSSRTYSATTNRVVVVMNDNTIKCWELDSGKAIKLVNAGIGTVKCAFNSDGDRLVVLHGFSLELWALKTKTMLGSMQSMFTTVTALRLMALNCNCIVSTNLDCPTITPATINKSFPPEIICCSGDGRLFAAASAVLVGEFDICICEIDCYRIKFPAVFNTKCKCEADVRALCFGNNDSRLYASVINLHNMISIVYWDFTCSDAVMQSINVKLHAYWTLSVCGPDRLIWLSSGSIVIAGTTVSTTIARKLYYYSKVTEISTVDGTIMCEQTYPQCELHLFVQPPSVILL
jgi:WD40 repeat protein